MARQVAEQCSLPYADEVYQIIGACIAVHQDKGSSFLEAVYQECLAIECELRGIDFAEHPQMRIQYKGRELKQRYVPDFVMFNEVLVELKAVRTIADEHRAQVINYLHASGMQIGLLVNFGAYPKLEWQRLVVGDLDTAAL